MKGLEQKKPQGSKPHKSRCCFDIFVSQIVTTGKVVMYTESLA